MFKDLKKEALDYHRLPKPGKTGIHVSKPTETQYDLSLAYTPGVAEPVREIANNPEAAYSYTNKGNLVAVITNGTAVLGLGDVGALAGKPVMEGKAVLFKRFADIDVFDIEVHADTPDRFIRTVASIAPTFGGINLEDIKAPECFVIEQALREQLDIPVFHDDQHGTAIIIAAGLLNALALQGKKIEEAKMVCLGAGAAGMASMRLLISLGAKKDHIYMIDRQGVIHTGRENLSQYKFAFAIDTDKRTLADAMQGADVFIGLSGPNLVSKQMIETMSDKPIVFALSNPDPEITPAEVVSVRNDVVMATGRSDYPNQVNNVLGFPFIFRGALDVRATKINEAMQIAAVHALKDLTHEAAPECVQKAYPNDDFTFGPNYIIPKPLDPRLRERVSTAVAQAAVASGVARVNYKVEPVTE